MVQGCIALGPLQIQPEAHEQATTPNPVAGLVPTTHVSGASEKDLGARDEPGHGVIPKR